MLRAQLEAGMRFGRLVVTEEGPPRAFATARLRTAICRCDCGATTTVLLSHLRSGRTKSCGCGHAPEKHGASKRGPLRPLYAIWCAMIQRCTNPNNRHWKNYGGRGITVCAEWRASFPAFSTHVGARPAPRLTLDRIDNDRGYEPGNVRWATRTQQNLNSRRAKSRRQDHDSGCVCAPCKAAIQAAAKESGF